MTELEWIAQRRMLRRLLEIARRGAYLARNEESYQALRDAEDALRLHMDNKKWLIS